MKDSQLPDDGYISSVKAACQVGKAWLESMGTAPVKDNGVEEWVVHLGEQEEGVQLRN